MFSTPFSQASSFYPLLGSDSKSVYVFGSILRGGAENRNRDRAPSDQGDGIEEKGNG